MVSQFEPRLETRQLNRTCNNTRHPTRPLNLGAYAPGLASHTSETFPSAVQQTQTKPAETPSQRCPPATPPGSDRPRRTSCTGAVNVCLPSSVPGHSGSAKNFARPFDKAPQPLNLRRSLLPDGMQRNVRNVLVACICSQNSGRAHSAHTAMLNCKIHSCMAGSATPTTAARSGPLSRCAPPRQSRRNSFCRSAPQLLQPHEERQCALAREVVTNKLSAARLAVTYQLQACPAAHFMSSPLKASAKLGSRGATNTTQAVWLLIARYPLTPRNRNAPSCA